MAVQSIAQARSIAMCAPRRWTCERPEGFSNFDFGFSIVYPVQLATAVCFSHPNRKSAIENLKSLGVPVGMVQTAFTGVFESLYMGVRSRRVLRAHPQIEIKLFIKK